MHPTTLTAVLQYRNEDVLSRFTDMFDITQEEAEDIFTETKKYLFICRKREVFIPDELLIVDEMWHNFILFTPVYQEFCSSYFGAFLHHIPATNADKLRQQQELEADAIAARKVFKDKLARLMSVTYDELGEDTVIKWFREYPVKYSIQAIKNLRKN